MQRQITSPKLITKAMRRDAAKARVVDRADSRKAKAIANVLCAEFIDAIDDILEGIDDLDNVAVVIDMDATDIDECAAPPKGWTVANG
jgi:hypothetical protein